MVDFDVYKADSLNKNDILFQQWQLLTLLANFCISTNAKYRNVEEEFFVPSNRRNFINHLWKKTKKYYDESEDNFQLYRLVSILGDCTNNDDGQGGGSSLIRTFDSDVLKECVAKCHEKGHCCGNHNLTSEVYCDFELYKMLPKKYTNIILLC